MKIETDDFHIRKEALNPTQSYIVQAPAGSGKTTLLINRFLRLLTDVNRPEEILAITFTRKAAAEMRERLLKILHLTATQDCQIDEINHETAALAKAALNQNRKLQWGILENPHILKIQTIDSFCATLTRELPFISQFGTEATITTEPSALYQEAVDDLLYHAINDQRVSAHIKQALSVVDSDINKLHTLLQDMLAKRDQWLFSISSFTHEEEMRNHLEQNIAIITDHYLHSMIEKISPLIINELLYFNQILSGTEMSKNQIHSLFFWKTIKSIIFTQDFSIRKRCDTSIGFQSLTSIQNPREKEEHKKLRERFLSLMSVIDQNENTKDSLKELVLLPFPYYQDHEWQSLYSLIQLLKLSAACLKLIFQKHGKIDFIENANGALNALFHQGTPTDLALSLDYQIKHILVDEFQDTSIIQFKLLESLTATWEENDGKTLFIVGDPMQSIYRFRQAEVALFLKLKRKGIGNIKLKPLTLSLNFRSDEKIVHWNNQVFDRIFPAIEDISKGAVTYSSSISGKKNTDISQHPTISIFTYADSEQKQDDERDDDSTSTKETQWITQQIKKILNYSNKETIAVLVRSRSHLDNVISAFKQNNILFKAVDIDPLHQEPVIQDLLSLTLALLDPADRLSWLAILRAPWCGLSLVDLKQIADQHTIIINSLNSRALLATLSSDGQSRLNKILPILNDLIQNRQRAPLNICINNAWILLGGPACLEKKSSLEDVNKYFTLLSKCESQTLSLNATQLKEKMLQLYANTDAENHRVELLTIHAAKGLEYDHVFLPSLEKVIKNDEQSLLNWIDLPIHDTSRNEKSLLLLAAMDGITIEKDQRQQSLYQFITRRKKEILTHELDRLFYVAKTRAKKSISLSFESKIKNGGQEILTSGSFLKKLFPFIAETQTQSTTLPWISFIKDNENMNNDIIKNSSNLYMKRLPVTFINPFSTTSLASFNMHHGPTGFMRIEATPRRIGTLVHRILQQISFDSIWDWQARIHTPAFYHWLQRELQQWGTPLSSLENAQILIQEMLSRILHDTKGQWILSAHKETQSELPLTVILHGKIEHVVIDRTFIDDAGNRWIIDYKTSEKPDPSQYQDQLYKYRDAMSLYDNKHPICLGLYFLAIPQWIEVI